MTGKLEHTNDRIGQILEFITKLAAGDLSTRETPSGKDDDLDGIIIGLNMLAEELTYRLISQSEAEKRLDEIMEVIMAIATLDYSKRAPISDSGDTFDAIASGLNALGEELYSSTVSIDFLDKIIQSMSETLTVLTPQAKIKKVNLAASHMLGYAESELLGLHISEIFDPQAFKELGFDNLLKNGIISNVESECTARDGRKIPVSFSGSVMQGEDDQVEGIVCVIHDISERKQLEEERQMRQERLAVLGQLAGGVGHELRNPLGAIKNSVYFLNMVLEDMDPEVQETLAILEKEVNSSERIISSLLDFARAKPPLKRKIEIGPIILDTLSRIKIAKNIEVENCLDDALPLVMADPDQLGRVFDNIIQNAFQAMTEGGRLQIEYRVTAPGWVALTFADTGVGIPEENLKRIFEPLFTSKAKGIGLGMAITKTFVEGHGGRIEVKSKTGVGTTFTVNLPTGLHQEG